MEKITLRVNKATKTKLNNLTERGKIKNTSQFIRRAIETQLYQTIILERKTKQQLEQKREIGENYNDTIKRLLEENQDE